MILLELLPVPPEFTRSSSADRLRREANREILHEVLGIHFEDMKKAGLAGVRLACADAQYRMCYPILCDWMADHAEHIQLHNLQQDVCPKCEVSRDCLGDLVSSPRRDDKKYQDVAQSFNDTGDPRKLEYLAERGLKAPFNVFWGMPHLL
jgi:hypothetical protein